MVFREYMPLMMFSITHQTRPSFHVAMLIPTGVGASQGGFGGDATIWMNLLASVVDALITHPNVANAAAFQMLPENTLYVEGLMLDDYFKGTIALKPVRANRIGVLLDAGLEPGMKVLQHNVVHAVQATYGVPVVCMSETTEPLRFSMGHEASGASGGNWLNPQAALNPAHCMINQHGVNAIAIVSRLEEPEGSTYAEGEGVDPIGGLEAIISHTLVRTLGIPCANAPCFDWEEAQPRRDALVHPFTASEYTTASFLPCVLRGLHRAPQAIPLLETVHPAPSLHQAFTMDTLAALVVPLDAMGGPGILGALHRRIPIIAVQSNTTILRFPLHKLIGEEGVRQLQEAGLYYEVGSYDEAAGLLQRLKLGLVAPNPAGIPRF
jgi:hypothetical protein